MPSFHQSNFFVTTMVLISSHICHLVTFHCHFLKNRNPKTVTGYDSVHQCSKHTQAVPFVMKGRLSYMYQYDSDSKVKLLQKTGVSGNLDQ